MSQYVFKPKENINPLVSSNGKVWEVYPKDFSILTGITCFMLELYDESMRLPHWHPNANELGYLLSGKLEIYMWKYTGTASVYTISPGMCWFIPMGTLHSLNNISDKTVVSVIGFNNANAQNIDLPVAFNGIPLPVRSVFTSPHSDLRNWKGTINNPFLGDLPLAYKGDKNRDLASPYRIDLNKVAPLYNGNLGSVVWAIKDNWNILTDAGISIMRIRLKPCTARDPIWYPDVVTLYVVTNGSAEFHIILPDVEPQVIKANEFSYVFVPIGTLHTFINTSSTKELEVIAFFDGENPQPEISLLLSTEFFPKEISNYALTRYANSSRPEDVEPLNNLVPINQTPYIIQLPQAQSVFTNCMF